jgi:hypothetical protein
MEKIKCSVKELMSEISHFLHLVMASNVKLGLTFSKISLFIFFLSPILLEFSAIPIVTKIMFFSGVNRRTILEMYRL